jgi:pimeloyl-ACP methyl ester carboxylesterase
VGKPADVQMATNNWFSGGRWLSCLVAACVVCAPTAQAGTNQDNVVDGVARSGLQTGVVFDDYFALSSTRELQRRILSPLQARRVDQTVARSGRALREQSIDLAKETFTVYVPQAKPQHGYALLVFVFPWDHPTLPAHWSDELDRHGMILVTPDGAGNGENVLDRREPLALLATHNILRRYPVDPERVYIGGLSGGSRVSLRLALAYPDLFHGALLNAGSGAFGNAKVRLPPADLMHRFQEGSRVVFITGEKDNAQLGDDVLGRLSMRNWCAFDYTTVTVPSLAHDILPAAAFKQGLDALEARDTPPKDKIASCRGRYEQELDAKLREAETLRADGRVDAAARMLEEIDVRFGGLAAPPSVDLARQIGH